MNKSIMAVALLTGFLAMAPAAHAGDIDVGISIGIPGIILGGPAYYPPPPRYYYRPYYQRPRVVVVPERVVVPAPRYYYDQPGWRGRGHSNHHDRKHWNNSWKSYGGHYGHGRGWDDD